MEADAKKDVVDKQGVWQRRQTHPSDDLEAVRI